MDGWSFETEKLLKNILIFGNKYGFLQSLSLFDKLNCGIVLKSMV